MRSLLRTIARPRLVLETRVDMKTLIIQAPGMSWTYQLNVLTSYTAIIFTVATSTCVHSPG